MNKKTILVAITGVLLAVAGGAVGATFSRYQSSATATPVAQVAKWHVEVGKTNISNGGEETFEANINWNENENVEKGYFAPGSKGTITFDIDANGTQVPIEYSIAINNSSISSHSQIKIDSVTAKQDEGTEQQLTKNESSTTYSGNINLADIDKKLTITVNVSWENSEANNSDDTSLGVGTAEGTNTVLSLPITVTASQKVT